MRATDSTECFFSADSEIEQSSDSSSPAHSDKSVDSGLLDQRCAALGLEGQQAASSAQQRTPGWLQRPCPISSSFSDASDSTATETTVARRLPPLAAQPPAADKQQQVDVIELLDSESESDVSWHVTSGTARKRGQVVDSSTSGSEGDSESDVRSPPRRARTDKGAAQQQQQQQQHPSLPPYFAAIPGLSSSSTSSSASAAVQRRQPGTPLPSSRASAVASALLGGGTAGTGAPPPLRPSQAQAATQLPAPRQQQKPQPCGPAAGASAGAGCAAWRALSLSSAAFRKQREALVAAMFAEYNAVIFEGKLPADLPIGWNNRLATTAGLTHYRREAPAGGGAPM